MEYIRIPAGIYEANCYIIYSKNLLEGIVIDPGGDEDKILDFINEKNISIKYIVLTHGHGDHIGGVKELTKRLNLPLLIHEDDLELVKDATLNLSNIMAMGPTELEPDAFLKDGESIEFGDLVGEIIHTPGHTKGGISIKVGNYLFTGDTLFQGSIGRTDLQGGDFNTIINSIKNKLLILPEDTIVLPGHGGESTIGRERLTNPFLR